MREHQGRSLGAHEADVGAMLPKSQETAGWKSLDLLCSKHRLMFLMTRRSFEQSKSRDSVIEVTN